MSQCGKLTTNTGLKTLYFHVMSYISSGIAGNILACILYAYLHVHVYPYTIINMIIHFCFFSKIQTTHKSMHAHVHLVNSMCMPSDSWDVLDTPLKYFVIIELQQNTHTHTSISLHTHTDSTAYWFPLNFLNIICLFFSASAMPCPYCLRLWSNMFCAKSPRADRHCLGIALLNDGNAVRRHWDS